MNQPIVLLSRIEDKSETIGVSDPTEQYRKILRQKNWRSVPLTVLEGCYHQFTELGGLPRSDISEVTVSRSGNTFTATDVRKTANLLFKAGLMESKDVPDTEEKYWQVCRRTIQEVTYAIDRAMLSRLLGGIEEASIQLKKEYLKPLLLQSRTAREIDKLIVEAQQLYKASVLDKTESRHTATLLE